MSQATFLRNVPVLAGLTDELLERLGAQLASVRLEAGAWLFHEGEPAESMFIVHGGRLEVLDEGPPESLIRVLRRGDVLGELALLREGRRSASVRASRDTELLVLARAEFEALVLEAPPFALGLTRAMGAQLAASRTPMASAAPPRTIAVVALDPGAPIAETDQALAARLARYGSVARLGAGDLGVIERAERDAERVVMRADAAGNDWSELCLQEADLVVAVTTGTPDPIWFRPTRAAALRGCELIVLSDRVDARLLAAWQPREVQVIADTGRSARAIAATARRLAGRSPGVVMSGGGARAFAHLGALEELRAAGIHFDRVGGVSLGSLVAGGVAMDLDSDALYAAFERAFVAANPTNDYAPPAYSLVRGGKTRALLAEAFGGRHIEALPLRFFCLSCDLIGREAVVHRTGPVAEAVYSSLAIPGVFPPVARNGRLLVDGGVLDNLPVATMARTGEGPVVALDVTGRAGAVTSSPRPRLARIGRPLRRALTGSEAEIPRLGETIVRTVTVGSSDTTAAARLHADLVITPPVEGVGLMDWKAIAMVRELGRQAVRDVLAADPGLPDRLMNQQTVH